jgi:hypothetical protein
LQFIAGYLGARILQSAGQDSWEETWKPAGSPDHDHKMIVLVEYLRQSGGPGEYLPT